MAVALASPWSAALGAEYTMTIAHLYPDDLANNEIAPAMERFRQVVESGTNGEVEVKVFGNGALGSEVETGKQAQKGRTVQSVLISSGATSSFFKSYQIATTPFLFPNYQTAWEFFDSEYFANFMRGALTSSGLRYLGTFDDGGGFVAFTNNKRLIRTLADLKGLKIRVEENPAHIATMKALGVNPTPLPWAEVPTALTTGLADGQSAMDRNAQHHGGPEAQRAHRRHHGHSAPAEVCTSRGPVGESVHRRILWGNARLVRHRVLRELDASLHGLG